MIPLFAFSLSITCINCRTISSPTFLVVYCLHSTINFKGKLPFAMEMAMRSYPPSLVRLVISTSYPWERNSSATTSSKVCDSSFKIRLLSLKISVIIRFNLPDSCNIAWLDSLCSPPAPMEATRSRLYLAKIRSLSTI